MLYSIFFELSEFSEFSEPSEFSDTKLLHFQNLFVIFAMRLQHSVEICPQTRRRTTLIIKTFSLCFLPKPTQQEEPN